MTNELPGEWGEVLGPKGVHSYRDLAAKTGISAGTAHRLVTGGSTSSDTVNKVADVLFGGDRDAVWRLRGADVRDYGDWSLPAEASLLNADQREAILRLVQVMVPVEAPAPKRATLKAIPESAEAIRQDVQRGKKAARGGRQRGRES